MGQKRGNQKQAKEEGEEKETKSKGKTLQKRVWGSMKEKGKGHWGNRRQGAREGTMRKGGTGLPRGKEKIEHSNARAER